MKEALKEIVASPIGVIATVILLCVTSLVLAGKLDAEKMVAVVAALMNAVIVSWSLSKRSETKKEGDSDGK